MTTLLLDADIIAFKIASTSQKTFQFSPDDEPSLLLDDWEEVEPRIVRAIDDLKESLDTDKVIVCLSCPTTENWRLKVLPTYKANRDYSKRPVHLAAVKDYLAENYPSYRRPTLEADDIMGILSTMQGLPKSLVVEHPEFASPGRKVIVSEDKDMKTVPGWLFNPAKDSKPRLIEPDQADFWHLYQTVCGDVTDGYAGCPGAGPEAALELLGEPFLWHSYQHTFTRGPRKGLQETRWQQVRPDEGVTKWEAVVSRFEKHGLTEEDALTQARVARICRASDFDFNTKQVRLWTPDSSSLPEAATA